MSCDGTDDGCPEGQYRCRPCGGSSGRVVCKKCRSTPNAQRVPPVVVDEPGWSWCSGRGPAAECVPMARFATHAEAIAWFASIGRTKPRLIRVDDLTAVAWL